jgi:hypothetical protein
MTMHLLALLAALAQPGSPAQPAEKPQPAPAKPAQPEPTLDELLGLPQPPKAPGEPAKPDAPEPPRPTDPTRAELERQLSPGEVNDLFNQAVTLMDQTALRLTDARDTGIDTQRMQEDVIRKLDTLIDEAKKRQSRSKQRSRTSQQQQQQPQNQAQQSSQQAAQRSNQSQNDGPGPAMTQGARNASPGGTAAWGNLPAHIRDALSQGRSEQYSSMYKQLTEKYYKRLAEEPKPGELPRQP